MQGTTRVVIFCTLTAVLPTLLLMAPLYLRHSLYASVTYSVAESDVMEIEDGISTIFCSEHTLKMDRPFHAFRVSQQPEVSAYRKHIRLKKSMTLPDDTLEYWGFYLLKGATVALSVCSRFQGASILVVRGERSLRTCGMMKHNENKKPFMKPGVEQQVQITFQSNAQIVNSKELEEPSDANQIPLDEPDALKNHHDGASLLVKNRPNNSSGSNLKDSFNATDYDLELLRAAAVNHIQKHTASKNGTNNSTTSDSKASSNTMDHKLDLLREVAVNHIQKHTAGKNGTTNSLENLRHMRKRLQKLSFQRENITKTENREPRKSIESIPKTGTERLSKRSVDHDERIRLLESVLNSNSESPGEYDEDEQILSRAKRSQNGINPPILLDRGIEHGGNALNFTQVDEDSSMSSFENGLLTCYNGHVLLTQQFEPSELCTNVSFLLNSKRIQTQHDIIESGYYYYIFYSDNDIVSNDMHAIFDIYKPTFQYENLTQSCLNKTECSFSIDFLSADRVIVEVPTKNGIDNAEDDLSLLTSTCHPRMSIYTIFPIAVLLLVLGCAFI